MRIRTPGLIRPLLVLAALAFVAAVQALGAEAQTSAEQRQLLNSERIEQRFGSYGIEVLASDGRLRVASLYSTEPEGRVCRTFAVTRYPSVIEPAFADEHAVILDGGSIGAVFAGRGWQVERRHLWLGEVPPSTKVLALMGGVAPAPLAVHLFELIVSRDGASYRYATIAEVHHPAYLTADELRSIFGADWRAADSLDTATGMLGVALEAMR